MSLPTPFYQDASCTIYNADCREILPLIDADCVVTDPPYLALNTGVPIGMTGNTGGGVATVYHQSKSVEMPWGYSLDWIDLIGTAKHWFVYANYKMLGELCSKLDPQTIFVWRKSNAPNMTRPVPRMDCEFIVWSRTGGTCDRMGEFKSMVIDVPMLQAGCMAHERLTERNSGKALHPCQKPLAVVRPFISRIDASLIVDPFMGTGTTLLAAKLEGRKAVGIEISEKYCEAAASRLRQSVFAFDEVCV